jgi:hypothetical protein
MERPNAINMGMIPNAAKRTISFDLIDHPLVPSKIVSLTDISSGSFHGRPRFHGMRFIHPSGFGSLPLKNR